MSQKKPPKALGPTGRRVWREVHAAVAPGWVLDERDLLVLEHAGREADLIADLEAALERDGVVVKGAAGQDRLHGAVTALSQARALLARLLAQVEIAPPQPRTGHMNSRQRNEFRYAQGVRRIDGSAG